MNHPTKTIAVLLALVASLAFASCGSSDDSTITSAQQTNNEKETSRPGDEALPTIVIRDGKPVGGVEELEYDAGDQIRFKVRSDVADEVHVHGYDVEEEIPADGSATLSFPADIEGIFEVELHEGEQQIAELRVNP
jgi:major membrane immunogen (membrane-anchored lipoprotein)